MRDKRRFYFNHGAEEYYEFDPEAGTWLGFVLNAETGLPDQVSVMDDFASPLDLVRRASLMGRVTREVEQLVGEGVPGRGIADLGGVYDYDGRPSWFGRRVVR